MAFVLELFCFGWLVGMDMEKWMVNLLANSKEKLCPNLITKLGHIDIVSIIVILLSTFYQFNIKDSMTIYDRNSC